MLAHERGARLAPASSRGHTLLDGEGPAASREVVEVEVESEVVEFESETESEAKLQSIFYPWTKVNWMYHPEE